MRWCNVMTDWCPDDRDGGGPMTAWGWTDEVAWGKKVRGWREGDAIEAMIWRG